MTPIGPNGKTIYVSNSLKRKNNVVLSTKNNNYHWAPISRTFSPKATVLTLPPSRFSASKINMFRKPCDKSFVAAAIPAAPAPTITIFRFKFIFTRSDRNVTDTNLLNWRIPINIRVQCVVRVDDGCVVVVVVVVLLVAFNFTTWKLFECSLHQNTADMTAVRIIFMVCLLYYGKINRMQLRR